MTTCSRCGHRIEVGRFCINCGAPAEPPGPSATAVIGPTDTVERPVVSPAGPPPSAQPSAPPPPPLPPAPSAARYPLFADEVREGPSATAHLPASPASSPAPGPAHRGGSGWLVWVVSAAVLVVVGLVGATLLLAGGDDDEADRAATDTSTSGAPTPDGAPDSAPGSAAVEPTPSVPSPTAEEPPSDEPRDVSADAVAAVPATAPPGTAADGTRTRYDATQMLDDDPGTCWRMAGDGTGEEITLTLAEPTLVTGLGLVNGYAKTAQDGDRRLDWYRGNRRVLAVEWVLDDGTVVPQDLRETRDLQRVEIDPVVTGSVVLRLVEVSGPGRGRAARDNTAISELAVVGTPEAG